MLEVSKMAPPEEQSSTGRRSRRNKKESSGFRKALDQIKKYNETGERSSYEVGEKDSLYEEVDEKEYANIVRQRQEENWIVDDDGSGYYDDGREVFDEDPNEEPEEESKKKKGDRKENAKSKVNSNKITALFRAKSKVKKEEDVSVNNDNVLDDILQNITTSKPHDKSLESKKPFQKTPKRTVFEKRPVPRRLQEEGASNSQTRPVTRFRVPKEAMPKKHLSPLKKIKQEIVDDENGEADIDLMPTEEDQEMESLDNQAVKKEIKQELEEDFDLANDLDIQDDIDIDQIAEPKKTEAARREEIEDESDISGIRMTWEQVMEENKMEKGDEAFTNITVDSSQLPLTDVDGEKVLKFFMLDAYEDSYHQPGTVYLFGKVFVDSAASHVSCCVTVKNIERRLFVLPRKYKLDQSGKETSQEVTMKDVYEEFNNIATKMKIMNFKCKATKMKYAFELPDVPSESDYLEVLYPADQPQIPKDKSGSTFSHIFGTNTSSLEHLVIGRKLKGPSWLDIKYPQVPKQPVSWCKIEALVSKPDFITTSAEQSAAPKLTVLSLATRTVRNSKSHVHEILALSGVINNHFYLDKAAPGNKFDQCFCLVTKPTEFVLPYDFQSVIQREQRKIQTCTSERSLLALFLARIQAIDPDIIVGNDIIGFDFDVILHRIAANKVPHWSKLGRLKRQNLPKLSGHQGHKGFQTGDKNTACGRLICDTKISAKELIRCKSYDLTELSYVVLNKTIRMKVDVDEVPSHMRNSRDLLKILDLTTMDSLYNLRIVFELNALPLAYQITGVCGNIMSRTLQGGRSERNEFLLLHAFAKENYICPDKSYSKKPEAHFNEHGELVEDSKKAKGRKKPQYAGGLVLEPKRGFYDKFILLLDFNSLYPSIIQEYNICFTTVTRDSNQNGDDVIPEVPDSSLPPGILPTEIRKLVERRKQVKSMMKTVSRDSDAYLQFDIRQKALKLTANSMYGCLGFTHSRFLAKPLAAMVTLKGREILMKTKDLVQALNFDVIYGDTDSIMINTNSIDFDEVYKIGNKIKNEVNKLYKLLEIDIDGIYKSMLLLKKKKYAALAVQKLENGHVIESKELKGLDVVRRDWCDLAKNLGEFAINQILSGQSCDTVIDNIHERLVQVKEQMADNKVPARLFEISKALAKAPDEYSDTKSLPHVTVAQRLMSQGKRVAVGDTIRYIICDDGSSLPASQRAYHPDEYSKNKNLRIDHHYYLANQIHPVVSRLCDPIEGTNAALIAECLGLDASNYSAGPSHATNEDDSHASKALMPEEERFKDVVKFEIQCQNASCKLYKQSVVFEGALSKEKNPWQCTECRNEYSQIYLMNKLTMFIRQHINQYYKGHMFCDDYMCGTKTRLVRLKAEFDGQVCASCETGHLRQIYSEAKLYNQLYYLRRVFCGKADGSTKVPNKAPFEKKLNSLMQLNGFSIVNMSDLFGFMSKIKS
ncbi:DNA polymerase alpha catalytic subunit-like [Rhopilema esculentum]|uniref:DNA polymerase alpha catalytic subunit-like n=1 Tax=Rhopilema esculentum TaxID=499914 RepID=UPI0031D9C404